MRTGRTEHVTRLSDLALVVGSRDAHIQCQERRSTTVQMTAIKLFNSGIPILESGRHPQACQYVSCKVSDGDVN
jgi:hypothetical protein